MYRASFDSTQGSEGCQARLATVRSIRTASGSEPAGGQTQVPNSLFLHKKTGGRLEDACSQAGSPPLAVLTLEAAEAGPTTD